MLLDINKVATVEVPQADAWWLLRDVPRLTACLPNTVHDVQVVAPDRRYTAVVSDRIGPFALSVPVSIAVRLVEEPRQITADLTGDDKRGQARVRGTLDATADASSATSTELRLSLRLEILGRLATLGAAPIRRRADEVLAELMRNLQAELSRGRDDDAALPRGDEHPAGGDLPHAGRLGGLNPVRSGAA